MVWRSAHAGSARSRRRSTNPAVAVRAIGNFDSGEFDTVEMHIAIRSEIGRLVLKLWIARKQVILYVAAGERNSAVKADNAVEVAVQVDHPTAARALMQSVDILGDDDRHIAKFL